MRGRPHKIETGEDLIHHYIFLYYKSIDKDPGLRSNDEAHHIQYIYELNARYQYHLQKNPQIDQQKYEPAFIECIDFITKVFTKKREREEKERRNREYFQSIIKKKP